MAKFLGAITGLVLVALLIVGINWCVWKLWLFVVPALWPTGPEQLVHPGFWLFFATWTLLSWLGSAVFGRS